MKQKWIVLLAGCFFTIGLSYGQSDWEAAQQKKNADLAYNKGVGFFSVGSIPTGR